MDNEELRVPCVEEKEREAIVKDQMPALMSIVQCLLPNLLEDSTDYREKHGTIPLLWKGLSEEDLARCKLSLRFLVYGFRVFLRCWNEVQRARQNRNIKGTIMHMEQWEICSNHNPVGGLLRYTGIPWLKSPKSKKTKFVWCEEFVRMDSDLEIRRRGYWRVWGIKHPGRVELKASEQKLVRQNDSSSDCCLNDLPNDLVGLDWSPVNKCLILVRVREFYVYPQESLLASSYWELRTRVDVPIFWVPAFNTVTKRRHFIIRKYQENESVYQDLKMLKSGPWSLTKT